ncbi:MAG: sodium-translocating pyrophosphatase [bacterium]|nr:sodium-translocating pyrophosphatase [bacterium]
MAVEYIAGGAALLALLFALFLALRVRATADGQRHMMEIATAIKEGALAYLKRQYRVIALLTILITALFYAFVSWQSAVGFAAGAVISALAGYIGMRIAVVANVKTAEAAKDSISKALRVAFTAGTVTGMVVVGFGLLGVAGFYTWFKDPVLLIGFGFGASLVSLFARVGGGIYTKAADVGADLVGKLEKGIPEDDPRNPAVIADNVGDNVGDTAGMSADLFETYVVTLLAAMILGTTATVAGLGGVLLPLLLGAVAIVASIIGSFFVRLRGMNITGALYKGVGVTITLAALGFYLINRWYAGNDLNLYGAMLVGLVVTILVIVITNTFTARNHKAVDEIAKASETGPGTNIIAGLAVGLRSTWPMVVVIVAAILAAFYFSGVYGIALAAVSMLSTMGIIVAIDAYGPITDNAGGIAEMANLPAKVRSKTDALDAVGNTTKAITKGYAIGSAALATLALFAAYTDEIREVITGATLSRSLSLENPLVIVGLFIGAALPFFFSSQLMTAVGKAAFAVVEAVREQFRTKKIMEGQDKPDYAQVVDIVTKAAQKYLIMPAVVAIAVTMLVGFGLGPIALGAMLIGVILSGFFLAIQMTTGGAAWDNAKKHIETGKYGGKGSEAHKAAIVGDTVGDPFKDTAGPALNSLIKVINTLAVIFAFLFVQYGQWFDRFIN